MVNLKYLYAICGMVNAMVVVTCDACEGKGQVPNYNYQGERITGTHDCPFCRGKGVIMTVTRRKER